MISNGYLNISTLYMHYFLVVVECGSFTNAANQLFITQSALSKAISSMEKTMDVQLFIRNKKRLQVTEAGCHLYEKWRLALHDIETSVAECRAKQGGQMGTLLVGGLDTHKLNVVILPIIREYRRRYPNNQVYIETNSATELRRGLVNGSFDVVITTMYDMEQLGTEGFDYTVIATSPHHICVMKEHPLAEKVSIDILDLKDYPFVSISSSDTPSYNGMLFDLCTPYGFLPHITRYVSSANDMVYNLFSPQELFICDPYYIGSDNPAVTLRPINGTESGVVAAWRKDGCKKKNVNFIKLLERLCTPPSCQ